MPTPEPDPGADPADPAAAAPPPEPPLPAPGWPAIDAWLHAGYPDVRHLDVDALRAWLADPARAPPVLLDARAPAEFDVGHLPGARRASTLDEALDALAGVPADAPVVCYCSVGVRSARLARALAARGRPGAANLRGSIFAWANGGGPVVDARGEAARVHPFDARWGRLLEPSRRATG